MKLCIDCKWIVTAPPPDPIVDAVPEDYRMPYCGYPDMLSPVDGKPFMLCQSSRFGGCGFDGAYWEARA